MSAPVKRQPIPFGKYLLLDRINIGGMAEVWRGKTFGAGGFERLVAIKRILPNIAEDAEFISMFIDEAKITVQLNHANIAQIYELSHIANSYFIAMEYIPGKDMRAIFDRCRRKGEPAPIPLTCYVVSKCCEGLDYAHRKQVNGREMNIVHRDVSPQNVLISYEGEVKVIDFGIAKAAGKATKTQAGILKGKFGYMSPEQIRGLPLDRRSDVFAIGVCLYEMLTGERLFIGDSDFSVLEKVRKVDVLPPSTYNRKIPEGLEKIVMKALAKDVDDRYQYASEVADDLQRFLITSDNIFSRKDLALYMKSTFAEDVDREKQRLTDYADVRAVDGASEASAVSEGMDQSTAEISRPAIESLIEAPISLTPVPPAKPREAVSRVGPPVLTPVPPTINPEPRPAGAMPKLTAAAPMLTNDKEDNSTQLVNGDTLFTPVSRDAVGPVPSEHGSESATVAMAGPLLDASVPSLLGESAIPTGTLPAPAQVGSLAAPAVPPPPPAPSGPPAWASTVIEPPRASKGKPSRQLARSERPPEPPPDSEAPAVEAGAPTLVPTTLPPGSEAPRRRRTAPSSHRLQPPPAPSPAPALKAPPAPAPTSNRLLLALIGVAVMLLAVAVTALILLRPKPTGLLLIEVPAEAEVVEVNVNGERVVEKDGSAIKSWPHLHQVKAGSTGVLIKVKGYAPLVDTVLVKEGGEVTYLSKKFQKSE